METTSHRLIPDYQNRLKGVILPQFSGVVECGKAVFLKQGDDDAKTTTHLYRRV
jgi:hypothetical protein